MDTRNKIVEAAAVPRPEGKLRLITGYFDPLYAASVRRLSELGAGDATTVVALATPEAPLLPWRARAELVAALDCVDYVVDAAHAGAIEADEVFDERAADALRTEALTRLVVSRTGT